MVGVTNLVANRFVVVVASLILHLYLWKGVLFPAHYHLVASSGFVRMVLVQQIRCTCQALCFHHWVFLVIHSALGCSLLAFLVLVAALAFHSVEASCDHEVEVVRSVRGAFAAVEAYYHSDSCEGVVDLVFLQVEEAEFYFVVVVVVVRIVAVVVAHRTEAEIAVVEVRSSVVLDHNFVAEDREWTEAVRDSRMDCQHLHKGCRRIDHNFVQHSFALRSLANSCCHVARYLMVMVEGSLLVRIRYSIGCFVVGAA